MCLKGYSRILDFHLVKSEKSLLNIAGEQVKQKQLTCIREGCTDFNQYVKATSDKDNISSLFLAVAL